MSSWNTIFVVAAFFLWGLSIRIPSNPPTDPSRSLFAQKQVPPHVSVVLTRACFDCHSNETHWPWYAHAPGASLILARDVTQGREHLNLSDWQSLRDKGPEQEAAKFSEICENLLSGAMPKPYYTWVHPAARLTKQQVSDVCAWADQQQMKARSVAIAVHGK